MNTTVFTDEIDPASDSTGFIPGLRVVVAYEDVDSGRRAIRVLRNVAIGLGEEIRVEPLPWSFGLLADADWRTVAASDAIRAHVLIIARGPSGSPPSERERSSEVSPHGRGMSGALVVSFEPDEDAGETNSERVEWVRRGAEREGWELYAALASHELEEALDRIHQRAEMVTPLLMEILDRHAGSGNFARIFDPQAP